MKSEVTLSAKEQYLEDNRHGLICAVILAVGCLGGITVGFRAIENLFALSLVVFPTMATLCLLLSVSPMKWIVNMAVVSIVIDLILLTYYFFV